MANSTSSTPGSSTSLNPSEYTLQLYSQLTGPDSVKSAKIRIGLVKSVLESKGIPFSTPPYGDMHHYFNVSVEMLDRWFSISCCPRGGIYATFFAEIMNTERIDGGCYDFVTFDDFRNNVVSVMNTLT